MARDHVTTADTYSVTWTVEPGEAGQRFDLFLKGKYRRLSREFLQKSIKEGKVTLNRKTSKPSQVLRVGDKIHALSTKGEEPEVDFNYRVLYEDDQVLVVDKPGNLPVHPTGRYFFHTLLTQLRVENGNEVDQKKEFYVVHRIDRETSGVLVLGKTKEAAASLVSQFEKRKTDKEYLAIVRGRLEKNMLIDVPLARDHRSEIKIKMGAVEMGADGEPLYIPKNEMLVASTAVEVVELFPKYTLVRCLPHTGRQHQIRVHLDHIGHPLVGDKLYGVDSSVFLRSMREVFPIEVEPGIFLGRHALHAYRLRFTHPSTGKPMEFESALPEELDEFLSRVR